MGFVDLFIRKPKVQQSEAEKLWQQQYGTLGSTSALTGENPLFDMFKAYIPEFMYKPPFGYPRYVNLPLLRLLAKNPYSFSIHKTIISQIASLGHNIKVKEEFKEQAEKYEEKRKEILRFFDNPNGNKESWATIKKKWVTDILELDSGVLVKVFNRQGKFSQLFCRDGSSFLINPDRYGYLGNRADIIPPIPQEAWQTQQTATLGVDFVQNYYQQTISNQAAYYQYSMSGGAMPIPFGKREIIFTMDNPRPEGVYGRSPLEILEDVLLTCIYGSKYNLGIYTNNNMPEGVIQVLGAEKKKILQFRKNFENSFKHRDEFGKERKSFWKIPIVNREVKFTPFQLVTKDLQLLEQQEWFYKIVMACYNLSPDELGFTEKSNKAVSEQQTKLIKRKVMRPLLDLLEYEINSQILPEFFADEIGVDNLGELNFGDCPFEFRFDTYDIEEEMQKHELWRIQLDLGIKTSEMIAAEAGVNLDELKESKEKEKENKPDDNTNNQSEPSKNKEPKQTDDNNDNNNLKSEKETIKAIEEYFKKIKDFVKEGLGDGF